MASKVRDGGEMQIKVHNWGLGCRGIGQKNIKEKPHGHRQECDCCGEEGLGDKR